MLTQGNTVLVGRCPGLSYILQSYVDGSRLLEKLDLDERKQANNEQKQAGGNEVFNLVHDMEFIATFYWF